MFLRKLWVTGTTTYKITKTLNFVSIVRLYNDIPFDDIPEVSTALIKKTLKTNNITFDEGYTCFIAPCPLCAKNVKQSAKIYINKTTGMFMCSFCKRNAHWSNFEISLSNKNTKKAKSKDNVAKEISEEDKIMQESLEQIRKNSSEIKIFEEDVVSSILMKFKLPVVSKSSLVNLDVRINAKETSLYFPLENVESEIVSYRQISSNNTKDLIIPSLEYGGLLTARHVKSKETTILVPNISDLLVLNNSKVSANIVCLPNNVSSLSQYVLPSLERFKKLILWFGNDTKSWDATRHFAKKLGEKRCLLVRPSDKYCLPHLDQKQDFKSIISNAQPMWHKSITTFHNLRDEVLSNLQNIDKVQGVKWTRYPALNKILKGHRRGELTVFTGPTGSGKTTFISDYSLDLAMQGVNTLWGSFEIRNARLAKTMLQQMSEIPLDENLHLFDYWADEFEKLPIYFMTFHGQQAIKVVMEAVEHATYVHDIAHLIIDNVQFMMGMSEEQRHMDRFWKQDVIIAAFRQFATRTNCHVTLVIHPRKERDEEDLTTSSIFGGAKASQEADNVLIIQDKRLTSVRGKKYLQIAKNRYSGDLGVMALEFDKNSLSYQQKRVKGKRTDETPDENQAQSKDGV